MKTRIAIACQGGGSHTAFTAGVLGTLATNWPDGYEFVGISGTSGGALCAGLFWEAWLAGSIEQAESRLRNFWMDNSATDPLDMWLNAWMTTAASLRGVIPHVELSPYDLPNWGQEKFAELLNEHFDLSGAQRLQSHSSPALLLGAVDVQLGSFRVFHSKREPLQNCMLLASAAIPNLFRAVEIDGRHYWDGLFSHNPPVVGLLEEGPEEVWIIQINPTQIRRLPRSVEEIEDRRNELAGNLSLEQEVASIQLINSLIAGGHLRHPRCRQVRIRRLILQLELDYASKLDRSPTLLKRLFGEGQKSAERFLTHDLVSPEQPISPS
jgi:NTE family protein